MKIIDISQPIFSAKVFGDDTAPQKKVKKTIACGYRLSDVEMCLHNATHIDAPSHYLDNGADIDATDLNKCFGRCLIVRTDGEIDGAFVSRLPSGVRRILFDGKGLIVPSGAEELVKSGVVLVGIARMSVADGNNCEAVHKTLLTNQTVVLEGLNLSAVDQGFYTLAAFPLRFTGCEASPVRAVLIDGAVEQ